MTMADTPRRPSAAAAASPPGPAPITTTSDIASSSWWPSQTCLPAGDGHPEVRRPSILACECAERLLRLPVPVRRRPIARRPDGFDDAVAGPVEVIVGLAPMRRVRGDELVHGRRVEREVLEDPLETD